MRLINAEALASDLMERWNTADEQAEKQIIAVLANVVTPILAGQPTVDAVEVVRCRYCKYQNKGENESESWNLCMFRPWLYIPTSDDHFCGYGERGDSDDE